MSQETDNKVAEFLTSKFITYEVTNRGVVTGQFDDPNQQMDAWGIRFKRGAQKDLKEYRTEYFTGLGLRGPVNYGVGIERGFLRVNTLAWERREATRKPVDPEAASVLYGLMLDSGIGQQTFPEFCGDFGYDTDSRKALETYLSCQETANKLAQFFTRDELAFFTEALQDY